MIHSMVVANRINSFVVSYALIYTRIPLSPTAALHPPSQSLMHARTLHPHFPLSTQRWIPLTGVGSGFTLDELSDLTDKLASKWVDYVPGTPAPDYLGGWVPSAKTRPDKFIRTIDSDVASVVLEIKGSEIFDTPDFPLGYTVRFARVVRIRFDKPLSEAATSDDILRMKERGMARKVSQVEDGLSVKSCMSAASYTMSYSSVY